MSVAFNSSDHSLLRPLVGGAGWRDRHRQVPDRLVE